MADKTKARESKLQKQLVEFLEWRGWLVERLIGNALQTGIPDLFTSHPAHGQRWIDVKREGAYSFTQAQKIKWPIWEKYGVGIWILTGPGQAQYDRLFGPPNWRDYWKPSWGAINVDTLLEQITL